LTSPSSAKAYFRRSIHRLQELGGRQAVAVVVAERPLVFSV
jgi:hypothetical protein